MTYLTLLATALALAIATAPRITWAQGGDRVAQRGYFSLAAEAGTGYFPRWNFDEQPSLEYFGVLYVNDRDRIGSSFRFALARHSRRDRLAYGLAYYRYQASKRWDGDFFDVEGNLLLRVEGTKLSEAGNYFNAFVEPRLMQRGRFGLAAHASLGLVWIEDGYFVVPIYGGPIQATTRRGYNYGFTELMSAFGLRGTYALNDRMRAYANLRSNYQISVQNWILQEVTIGLEIPLTANGRLPVVER